MTRTIVLGLLGGIGSGKSTVARLLADEGAIVLNADESAHRCLRDAAVRAELREAFGAEIFTASGDVDHAALARRVFTDEPQRLVLNRIVHPRVGAELRARVEEVRARAEPALVVLDVPLLLESDLNELCDVRVFVDAPEEARSARVQADRGWQPDELARREKTQKPLKDKQAAADYHLMNDGSVDAVRTRVQKLVRDLGFDTPT